MTDKNAEGGMGRGELTEKGKQDTGRGEPTEKGTQDMGRGELRKGNKLLPNSDITARPEMGKGHDLKPAACGEGRKSGLKWRNGGRP